MGEALRSGPARAPVIEGLPWLRPELEASLGRARAAIERHMDSAAAGALAEAAGEIAVVRGVLALIRSHGAARLASEILALLARLRASEGAGSDEAYAALSGATLQLEDYLDLLASGEPDRAVLLAPAINELRVARGQPLLGEAELFADQARSEALSSRIGLPPPADGETVQAIARRELPGFQQAFLAWFRGVTAGDPLARSPC